MGWNTVYKIQSAYSTSIINETSLSYQYNPKKVVQKLAKSLLPLTCSVRRGVALYSIKTLIRKGTFSNNMSSKVTMSFLVTDTALNKNDCLFFYPDSASGVSVVYCWLAQTTIFTSCFLCAFCPVKNFNTYKTLQIGKIDIMLATLTYLLTFRYNLNQNVRFSLPHTLKKSEELNFTSVFVIVTNDLAQFKQYFQLHITKHNANPANKRMWTVGINDRLVVDRC